MRGGNESGLERLHLRSECTEIGMVCLNTMGIVLS